MHITQVGVPDRIFVKNSEKSKKIVRQEKYENYTDVGNLLPEKKLKHGLFEIFSQFLFLIFNSGLVARSGTERCYFGS